MRKRQAIAISVTICMICSLLCSCRNKACEHSQYFSVGAKGWPYDTAYAFVPADSAASAISQMSALALAVRHTNAYQYSNIWVEVSYTPESNADSTAIDTFNIQLADEFGRWYGKGIGVGYQCVDTIMRNPDINTSKPIVLRHIMRADTLPNIEQVGFIAYF